MADAIDKLVFPSLYQPGFCGTNKRRTLDCYPLHSILGPDCYAEAFYRLQMQELWSWYLFPPATLLVKGIRLLNQEIQQDELELYTKAVEELQLVGHMIWKCLAKSGSVECCSPGGLHFSSCYLCISCRMEQAGSISISCLWEDLLVQMFFIRNWVWAFFKLN